MIDLHCHTTASDGGLTPGELIEKAYKEGLSTIAITDHDTVSGIEEAVGSAENLQIEVIPGIELSSSFNNYITEIHILGLFIDWKNSFLQETLENLRQYRYNRNVKLIQNLESAGIKISPDELSKSLETAGKPNFGTALTKKGYAKNQAEAMKKFLSDKNGIAKTQKERLSIEDAIDVIHEAGGLAVLAHPHLIKKELGSVSALYEFVEKIKKLGLDGIEVFYHGYNKKMVKDLKRIARNTGLFASGGSDYHHMSFRNSRLGFYGPKKNIPGDLVEKMKKHL